MNSPKIIDPLASQLAGDCRVWNDALQAAVLSIACDDAGPLCQHRLLKSDPCRDCPKKDSARETLIKRLLGLKRSPTSR